jgi:hypothetical protein
MPSLCWSGAIRYASWKWPKTGGVTCLRAPNLLTLALSIVALVHLAAYGQPNACPPDRPWQSHGYRLAVSTLDGCKEITVNDKVRLRLEQDFEFYWLVPSCPSCVKTQLVFARTLRPHQRLDLYRNGGFGLWVTEEVSPVAGSWPTEGGYLAYHGVGTSEPPPAESRKTIEEWENSPFWPFVTPAKELVTKILQQTSGPDSPPGTERLISLKAFRPRPAWVRIQTFAPGNGATLQIVCAYSEDGTGQQIRHYTIEQK